MAVTAANVKHDSADETASELRYTETWGVETNAATDSSSTVLQYPGLPVIGVLYPGDARATCRRRVPQLMNFTESRQYWEVVVEYSTKGEDEDEDEKEEPLNRPAKWSGSFQQFQAIAEKDRDDKPILNTAGDAFDPPLMKDDSRPVISCVKNFGSLNLNFWSSLRDVINSNSWGVFQEKTVKVMNISWDQKFHQNTVYYEVVFSFQINPDGWDAEILNRGYRQIENAGEEPKPITVSSKLGETLLTEPALLDQAGKLVPKSNLPQGAHYVDGKLYQKTNFSSLGIPQPGVRA